MALLSGDRILLSLRGTCFLQRIIMTQWYHVNADFPVPNTLTQDLQAILAAVAPAGPSDLATPYLALLSADYTLNEIRAQRIFPSRSAYEVNTLVGATGTFAGQCTVACDSAAITLHTPIAGRNQVSVKKVGPCPDGASAAGMITAPYRVLLQTLAVTMLTDILPGGGLPSLTPIIQHPGGIFFDRLTGLRIGTTSRVMNRRVVGRGE